MKVRINDEKLLFFPITHRLIIAAFIPATVLLQLSNLSLAIMAFAIVGGLYIIVKAHEVAK